MRNIFPIFNPLNFDLRILNKYSNVYIYKLKFITKKSQTNFTFNYIIKINKIK